MHLHQRDALAPKPAGRAAARVDDRLSVAAPRGGCKLGHHVAATAHPRAQAALGVAAEVALVQWQPKGSERRRDERGALSAIALGGVEEVEALGGRRPGNVGEACGVRLILGRPSDGADGQSWNVERADARAVGEGRS